MDSDIREVMAAGGAVDTVLPAEAAGGRVWRATIRDVPARTVLRDEFCRDGIGRGAADADEVFATHILWKGHPAPDALKVPIPSLPVAEGRQHLPDERACLIVQRGNDEFAPSIRAL